MTDIDVQISLNFHDICTRAVHPKMESLRTDIETDMTQGVPVETGRLRSSIFCHLNGDTITGGATAAYASFVELGTDEMDAEPFVRPAFSKERGEY